MAVWNPREDSGAKAISLDTTKVPANPLAGGAAAGSRLIQTERRPLDIGGLGRMPAGYLDPQLCKVAGIVTANDVML